jgi:hypothetical protein
MHKLFYYFSIAYFKRDLVKDKCFSNVYRNTILLFLTKDRGYNKDSSFEQEDQ